MAKDELDKQHAQRLLSNRENSTTAQIADLLFDLAIETKSDDIQDLAILADTLAGDGHEISADGLHKIVERVTIILEDR